MGANRLNILRPSVNNLTVRIFVRAAGLEFEEEDVWGKTTEPEFMAKYPARLTPMLEEEGLPRGAMGESCAIMAYLCNKHGLEQFYPSDPARRAMVDNAMFYLIGTFYPLLTRATYPTLEFLRSIDYEFPAWAEEYMARMEETLGDAYSEPVADVRGYVESVKAPAV